MKLLLDQGVPRSTAPLLRAKGFEVQHVGEVGMSAASDVDIIDYARRNQSCIVTFDADFHALLAAQGANSPSVIRLRLQRMKAPDVAVVVQRVFDRIGHEVAAGSVVTVTASSVRIRRLPLKVGHR